MSRKVALYSICNYDELYRPYDKGGRELSKATWVKVPAKPKGDGLQALLEYKRGLEVFAVWVLLLQKTTAEKKPESRGKLLNHRERPASTEEIAKGISLPRSVKLVEYALSVLIIMGWVECDNNVAMCHNDATQLHESPEQSSVVKSSVVKSKHIYAEFVLLTTEEYGKLCQEYGKAGADDWIEELDGAIGSKGYRYKSHYRTIRVWAKRREKEKAEKNEAKAHRRKCTVCGEPGTKYKVVAGEEIWRCPKHPHDPPKSKAPQLYEPKGTPPARDRQALKVKGLKKAKEM